MRDTKIKRSSNRSANTPSFITRLVFLAGIAFSANALADPSIVAPSSGSDLSGSAQTFSWDFDGTDVERAWLVVGTTAGGFDIANSGDLGTATEYDVIGIPADGSTIHSRLWTFSDSEWSFADSSYTAANVVVEASTPAMVSPANNATLGGASVEFTWSNNNSLVNHWWLTVGTTLGGADLYNSGDSIRTANSVTVNGLPVDGSDVHVRLWFRSATNGWEFADSVYSANSGAPTGGSETANYRITFNGTWSAETHPTNFPSDAHFSGLVGAVHSDQVVFWEAGQIATDGIELMAETGAKSIFLGEIDDAIASGHAESAIDGPGITLAPGSVSVDVTVSLANPKVTIATMLAPSPDWFTGFHDVSLHDGNEFVESLTLDGVVYDSGTDSGLQFTSDDSDTQPRDIIQRLSSDPSDAPFVQGLPIAGQFVIQRIR